MEKEAFEPTGLIPRSIIRTVDRFVQQLLPGREKIALQEYRVSRYQILVSIKSLATLVCLPLLLNFTIKALLFTPAVEHFWNSHQAEIFLNSYQEKRAFSEMHDFSEKMFFESLLIEGKGKAFPSQTPPTSHAMHTKGGLQSVALHIDKSTCTPCPSPYPSSYPCLPPFFARRGSLQVHTSAYKSKICSQSFARRFDALPLPVGHGHGHQIKDLYHVRARARKALQEDLYGDELGFAKGDGIGIGFAKAKGEGMSFAIAKGDGNCKSMVFAKGNDMQVDLYEEADLSNACIEDAQASVFRKPDLFVNPLHSPSFTLYESIPCDVTLADAHKSSLSSSKISLSAWRAHTFGEESEASRLFDEGSLLSLESDRYQSLFQIKSLELAKSYNKQSILAITNLLGDFLSFFTVSALFQIMRPELIILKSFLTESVYSLSDTTKSFLLILGMDLLVGFHSPRGWELALEAFLRHLGLPENENFILLFVALFPVFLDTVFKYWIFRYLNKISPSTVVTYHSMIE